jgi:hypothetical protein
MLHVLWWASVAPFCFSYSSHIKSLNENLLIITQTINLNVVGRTAHKHLKSLTNTSPVGLCSEWA